MEYASEHVRDVPIDGGEALEDLCKGIIVYRRQADGGWKVARDIWNSDGSAATP